MNEGIEMLEYLEIIMDELEVLEMFILVTIAEEMFQELEIFI